MDKANLNINTSAVKDFLINFLVPLVSFSLIALMFFVILLPTFRSLPVLQEELSTKITKKEILETKITNLSKLSKYKTVVAEDSMLVDTVLPSEAKVPELLDEVNQIAEEASLKVTRLSYSFSSPVDAGNTANVPTAGTPGAAATPSASKSVAVSLGASGSFNQMITFLETIENAARVVNVSNFRFTYQEGSEGAPSFLDINYALESPYLSVQSAAVTEDPLTLDITSKDFITFLNTIKSMKVYQFKSTVPPVVVEEPVQPVESTPEPTPTPEQ